MAESSSNAKFWVVDEHRPIDSKAPIDGEGVGGFLRTWREQRGWTLDQVSRALRIRLVHLQSIEDGRYSALPAKPYVVGFVRAYAELLQVDAEAVLRRLKVEMADLPDQQDLVFPEPPAERSIPGGALVSLSVCALIGIYGAWYYQTAQHHVRRDTVPPAPVADAAPAAAPENVTVAATSEPVAPAQMAQAPRPLPPPTAAGWQETQIPAAGRDSAAPRGPAAVSVPAGGAAQLAALPQAPAGQPAAQSVPPAFAPVQPAPAPAAGIMPPPLPSAAMVGTFRGEQQQHPAPVMRGAAPVQAAEVPGHGFNWSAATAPSGPIVLRAIEPSWIEVRSTSGEVIHGRLLKAGDTYAVPPRSDLRLTTGNAGGLEIGVGDETAPKVGPRGAVVRDIALDASRLLSGTAVARN